MRRTHFTLLVIFLYLLLSSIEPAHAQSLPDHGELKPFIHIFRPSDYHAYAQNFDVAQGPEGFIYVANKAGVLQYDGYHWNKITLPYHNIARQVELYNDTLFVGAKKSWGYITNDITGASEFVSLKKETEAAGPRVNTIWDLISTNKGLYILNGMRLMRWYKGKLYPFPDSLKIKNIFRGANQNLFAIRNNGSLVIVDDKTVQSVYLEEKQKNKSISRAYILKDGRLALITPYGLLILKNHKISPWVTEAQGLLNNALIINSIQLTNGNIALATTSGLLIISSSGKLLHHIDKTKGLHDNMIINLFTDDRGNIWLPMNNGLAVLKADFSVNYFGEEQLGGRVRDVAFYDNHVFISTVQATYKLVSSNKHNQFIKVLPPNTRCPYLLSTPEGLLSGCENGVKLYKNNKVKIISDHPNIFDLTQSDYDSNVIYAGSSQGIFPIYLANDQWKAGNFIYKGNIRSVFVTGRHNLIAESGTEGVIHLNIRNDSVLVNRYGKNNGLPSGPINLSKLGKLFLATSHDQSAWFRLGKKGFKIVETPFPSLNLKDIFPQDSTTAWGWNGKIFVKLTKTKEGWQWQPIDSGMFHPYAIDGIFPANDGGIWISGGNKLVHITKSGTARKIRPPKAPAFQKVLGLNGNAINFDPNRKTTIENSIKGFRVRFSSLPFLVPDKTTYQSRLIGFSDTWSPWSKEYFVDYSSIPPGHYQLQVRAKNIAGATSRISKLSLYVEPFWYQTWWAFILFILTSCSIITSLVYLRFRNYRKRSRLLEEQVAKRTQELSRSKDRIYQQAEQLKKLDQTKNQFYTNLSHEFRTPLTLILGPLQHILTTDSQKLPAHVQKTLEPALHGGQRLKRLVDQLLELTKIESEHIHAVVSLNDLAGLIRQTLSSFESLAKANKISLESSIPVVSCDIYFNLKQIETVLINLLSNAIKFTPAGGTVEVSLHETGTDAAIYVKDTGIGIDGTDIPHIFERFYQADSSMTRRAEGLGIGLAHSYKLVELHHGQLYVESKPGEGSTFILRLLKGRAHFKEDQIIGKEEQQAVEGANGSAESVGLVTPVNEKQELTMNDDDEDRKKLLVIDDNTNMRRYIRDIMKGDYQIMEAGDGNEGFHLAKEKLPDIILCDVMMPSTDGFTFNRNLKEEAMTASIPVIFLTGRADRKGRLEGFASGGDDYITKPFDAELLQARIKNMIKQRMRLRRFLHQNPPKTRNGPIRSPFEERVRAAILENMTNEQFGVKELAQEITVSKSHLTHKLKEETNMSASAYIRSLRLKQAAEMLKKQEGNISEVAYSVGFNSLSYFSRCFKKQFGTSPSEY